jgi:hypothetical protein
MNAFTKLFLVSMFMGVNTITMAQVVSAQRKGDNCENVSARLDGIRNDFLNEYTSQVIILIGRTGSKEKTGDLNQRRLYAVRAYLTAIGVPSGQFVTASGDTEIENGTVEIYYGGYLRHTIFAGKNADIRVGICDNDMEDYKKYQLPKARPKGGKR